MTARGDTDRSYFQRMYAGSDDPWGFDSSFYEHRKYDITIASLTRPTYRSAFEPGCANGALTERLATRCERLVACDFVGDVVERARRRLQHLDHVEVVEARFPTFWPDAPLDLVVWSEVAYYLGDAAMANALGSLDERLTEGGELVVVHFTGETNYPRTADEVDADITSSGILRPHTRLTSEGFRLDVWLRT